MDPVISFLAEIRPLRNDKKWIEIIEKIEIKNDFTSSKIVTEYFLALYNEGRMEEALNAVKLYENLPIDTVIIDNTDYLINYLAENKKIVASLDVNRKAKEDEIVIIYGDFPWGYENLIVNNPCYRHFTYFNTIGHDVVEHDEYWDSIDKIYIINLETREDRYLETVRELMKLNVPLDKIHRFIGVVADCWGCSASHLQVIQDMVKSEYNNVIVLEDDFSLTGFIDKIKRDLQLFLSRKYDYDICLLTCHIDCKKVPQDDLLWKTYTWCSTCGGYIISKQGAGKVLPIWTEALENLKKTKRHQNYACDVSWAEVQKDGKVFQFRNKVGFQRPQFSGGKFTFYMY